MDTEQVKAFVAVDLGASSGRVILGRVLHDSDQGPRVELHEVSRFPNGPVEVGGTLRWDILRIFQEVCEGLRAAARRVTERGDVLAGIGIDSWAVDYGLLDADGALLGNPVHYRDRRTAGVPQHVFDKVSAATHYAANGLQTQPFNTEFQLVASRGSTQLAAARRLLLVPDLLISWLTGEEVAEVTNASTTGLLDVQTRRWSSSLCEALGAAYPELPALLGAEGILPRLVEPGEVVGHLTGPVARSLGIAGTVPVVAVGSHDTASAVVAVPALRPDFAYISCGTWSLVGLELDAPVLSEASRAANFTNELGVDGTVRYLSNVMGLWLLQESVRRWEEAGLPTDLAELLAAAATVPPLRTVVDMDSADLLPPGDMPARLREAAARSGQDLPETQGEVVRCILDSLAVAYRRAVRLAGDLAGRSPEVIHVVGGGANNTLLCQLTADATGLPVVAGPVEGAALGNVLVQARAVGVLAGDLAALREVGARGVPLVTYLPGAGADPVDGELWAEAELRAYGPVRAQATV